MTLRSTVLEIQQLMISSEINVDRMETIPAHMLEPGVKRVDIYLDMHVPKDHRKAYDRVAKVLNEHFEQTVGSYGWEGLYRDSEPYVMIGLEIDSVDNQAMISVEEHLSEYMKEEEGTMTSFKQFLNEARKPGVNFKEEKTKGAVDKVIALLEGSEAGQLTKLARQYHHINKALKRMAEKKDELNKSLKDMVGVTFDPEADKFYTRVLASASFTVTLAKEQHPDDVAEKVEIEYERLVEGLKALLNESLLPAADALVESCTKRWKPEPRSPNLSVKALDEGVVETMTSWWRKAQAALAGMFAKFDKGLPKLEAKLEKYKAMPKPRKPVV